MQQQKLRLGDAVQDLNELKSQQLIATQKDKNHDFVELRGFNRKLSKISAENKEELNETKECLHHANRELKNKEKTIESLQAKVDRVNQLELNLSEKDAAFEAMKEQLSLSKSFLSHIEGLLSDSNIKVGELEAEVSRRKISQSKLFDSVANQTNQLQHQYMAVKEGGKTATIETKSSLNDIDLLKKEFKRAMQAEENNDKAMVDLALALNEVVAESNQAKEKLMSTEQQLEAVNEEATNLKQMVKLTEEKYRALLDEQAKENERLTNIVDRLRLEADESHFAWCRKEIEFVKCIKEIEDEKNVVQAENDKLMQSLREAEKRGEKLQEESRKLRDILKQALNEANAAKEAANLARTENSHLKATLAEKDRALDNLAQETHHLRINNIKDDVLGGSLSDRVEFPQKDPPADQRRSASARSSADDGTTLAFKNIDGDGMKTETSSPKKSKALVRRFGDMLRRKNSLPRS